MVAKFFKKEKRKTRTNIVRKHLWVKLVKNFDQNQMSESVYDNLQITHLDVYEIKAKFFRKLKKKNLERIFYENAPLSD